MTAHPQHRGAWPRRALAVLALSALAIAACSSGHARPQVAHLPGHGSRAQTTGQQTGAQMDRDMIYFARCMRAHGVQMRDPYHRTGHAGLSISVPAQTAANRPAFSACLHFLQPIIQMKNSHTAAEAAPIMGALAAYARCMRAHDISMLDPTPEGELNLGRVPGMNSDFGRYSPQFRAADAACRHLLPPGVHDDGTGP
ncbi:MAG: hypothetical protein ACTHJW_00960 [Streptosporangiaceae bacterium]